MFGENTKPGCNECPLRHEQVELPMLGDLLPEPIRLTFPCGATKESYERRLFDWVTNSMNLLWRD